MGVLCVADIVFVCVTTSLSLPICSEIAQFRNAAICSITKGADTFLKSLLWSYSWN